MSLYHETAAILDSRAQTGGNLKSRVYSNKDLKSLTAQVYALALESCKWSPILAEIIDNIQLLKKERKLSPILALLLVHDLLLSKRGIALPASHGLRTAVEGHKTRLTSELTRARIKRKCASLDALRAVVEVDFARAESDGHPRWIRVNTLRSSLKEQLATTFKDCERVETVQGIFANDQGGLGSKLSLYVDEHVPNLVAVSPHFDFAKSQAYGDGSIILQDKASCFPAYLLDPKLEMWDVIDACAAPGNKTTHAAAIMSSSQINTAGKQHVFAFEKDAVRVKTLEKMVNLAGAEGITKVTRQDFLQVDPFDSAYAKVGALLLDPSCSGSGIVGRDKMPTIHLPKSYEDLIAAPIGKSTSKKRKRGDNEDKKATNVPAERVLVDDDGSATVLTSEADLTARLTALSDFQLSLVLYAFNFPAAKRITYSTCSIHDQENEVIVMRALQSDIAKRRGWRILKRSEQADGMQRWPLRGKASACEGDEEIAQACVRAEQGDGRGTMGFFVAGFIRDGADDQSVVLNPIGAIAKSKTQRSQSQSGHERSDMQESDASDWGGFDD